MTEEKRYLQVAQSRSGTTRVFKVAEDRFVQVYLCKSGRVDFSDNIPAIPQSLTLRGIDREVWIEEVAGTWHYVDSRRRARALRDAWLDAIRHLHPVERPTFEDWCRKERDGTREISSM